MIKIRMVNIGLVRDATVDTSSLSVIMGWNNSGKSTVSTVLYAALKAASAFQASRYATSAHSYRAPMATGRGVRAEIISQFRHVMRDRAPGAGLESILHQAGIVVAPTVLERFGESLATELERGLGATLDEIATRDIETGRRLPAKIIVETPDWQVIVRLTASGAKASANVRSIRIDMESVPFAGADGEVLNAVLNDSEIVADILFRSVANSLFAHFPRGAHFLPAARAGLLQSHRLVAAAMLQRSSFVGLQEMSMPSLSGVVADFVSEILVNSPQRRSPLNRVADQIEESVLQGTVQQTFRETGYPEIEFTDEHGSHPVHRTSSMVSELAPVVLLLRSSVQIGDVMILEEPESHLHPAAQVELASALYELARRGVIVFVTTHSDYFLSAISNRVRDSRLRRRSKDVPLRAYWMGREPGGSHLEVLVADDYEGISDASFVEVAEKLYDERVEQQSALSSRTSDADN